MENKEAKEKSKDLHDYLNECPNKPLEEQIEKWKSEYGEIFVSGFAEDDLYIVRPITRPEWINVNIYIANPENKATQFTLEEMVCEGCILWKSKTDKSLANKAGTLSTLYEQIMQQSNFLNPQAASLLIAKL